jgi:hypothetical protein
MNTQKRLPEEFKIEAVKQVTERGHRVAEVAAWLDFSQHTILERSVRIPDPTKNRGVENLASQLNNLFCPASTKFRLFPINGGWALTKHD